jgi:hypothetical protein
MYISVVNPTRLSLCYLFIFVYWKYMFNNYLSLLLSRYGEKGNFAMNMGVAVWLADCWPYRIVHAWEDLFTKGRPYLLRLDRRHNQAESDREWFKSLGSLVKWEPFVVTKSCLANRWEHQIPINKWHKTL